MGRHSTGDRMDKVNIKDQGKIRQKSSASAYSVKGGDKVAVVRKGAGKHRAK